MTLDRNTFCDLLENNGIHPNNLIIMYMDDEIRWYGKVIKDRIHLMFPNDEMRLCSDLKHIFDNMPMDNHYHPSAVRRSYGAADRYKFQIINLTKRISKIKPL